MIDAFSGGRLVAQARPSGGRGKNPSFEGGKSAEVSTEGDGKALTVSYSADGSNLNAAAKDLNKAEEKLQDIGERTGDRAAKNLDKAEDKLQDAGERIGDSVSEVGDVIQEEVSEVGKEVWGRVQKVRLRSISL